MGSNLIIVLTALIAGGAGYFLRRYMSEKNLNNAEIQAQRIIQDSEKEVRNKRREMEIDLKDKYLKSKTDFERETKGRRQELLNIEKRVMQKEEHLDRKVDLIERKEMDINSREKSISQKENKITEKRNELEHVIEEERKKLQSISGLSREDAKKMLLSKLENEVKGESAAKIRQFEEDVRIKADREAKKIISLAIQKCAVDHTSERTVSSVALPSDDMKGRIIGREGRNIRALEAATGIDIIIDDTPEAVVLSGFDIVRREIAKKTLERLIEDGRIHPGRIEEVVSKVKKEMDVKIREIGERAAFDAGIHTLAPEIIKLLGRLQYRTSYGQNVLQHSIEVSNIMGIMAAELGLDVTLAKRIGMLHDIGKATTHEIEGPHATIGADLAKKHGEIPIVVNAIESHHADVEATSVLAVLTVAADAISAARPGARAETLEAYVKRLDNLETLASSFDGVEKAYAIQAGREIRVIVEPEQLNDDDALLLARNIAKNVQDELDYPGQIKVVVIRETRSIEYAK